MQDVNNRQKLCVWGEAGMEACTVFINLKVL